MFNQVLALAIGDENLRNSPKFEIYYLEGKIQVVLANMIADSFGVSASRVSRSLQSIGMTIEHKRVRLATKEGTISRKVRAIQVPNLQIWNEILQRYYFDEDGEPTPECPDCLKGAKFITKREPQKTLLDESNTNDKKRNTGKIDTPSTREVEHMEQLEQKSQDGNLECSTCSSCSTYAPVGVPENISSTEIEKSYNDFSELAGVRPDEYISTCGEKGIIHCILKGCGKPAAHKRNDTIQPLPLCTRHYTEWKAGWKEEGTS